MKFTNMTKLCIFISIIVLFGSACSNSGIELLNKDKLRQGFFEGLPYQIGSSIQIIEENIGAAKETGVYEEYKFYLYDLEGYAVFYLSDDQGIVQHIRLYPKLKMKLEQVRASLGEADVDDLGAIVEDIWGLIYDLGDYTLYVNGMKSDRMSDVSYLFLRQE